MSTSDLENDALKEVYLWVDSFDLSRPKKNITRDFSDGQLIAEIIYHYLPKVVNLHSFVKANSRPNKLANWKVLQTKVFPKMAFNPSKADIKEIVDCKRMSVENFLSVLRAKLENTEKVDLFATVNQPLKETKMKTAKLIKPKMDSFAMLEDAENGLDPKQKELREVLGLRDNIEDLEEKMLLLRKKLRYKDEQILLLEEKFRQSDSR